MENEDFFFSLQLFLADDPRNVSFKKLSFFDPPHNKGLPSLSYYISFIYAPNSHDSTEGRWCNSQAITPIYFQRFQDIVICLKSLFSFIVCRYW